MITCPPVVRRLTDRSVSGIPGVVTEDVWSGPCLVGIFMRPACVTAVGVKVAVRGYRVVGSFPMLVVGRGEWAGNEAESRMTRLEVGVNVPVLLLM